VRRYSQGVDVRWVTFDCFGTLVDWQSGFSALLSSLGGARTEDLVRAYHEIEPVVEADTPHRSYKEVLATSLQRAGRQVGVEFTPAQANALSRSWEMLPVFEDVEPMLAGLRAMGCRLAVLTNCDEDLFARTERSFRMPFDLVVTAERVRDYKPAPTHFRFFSRSSGVADRDWVHIAASWFHDILPTGHLGLNRVWLDRDGARENAVTAAPRPESAANGGLIRVRSGGEVCDAVARLYNRREPTR
jgi:2-haloacid dehalogenase